jgi:anti-sigma-K factor RskA
VTSLDDPDLNFRQTYDLTLIQRRAGAVVNVRTLVSGAAVAPSHVGKASIPDYKTLRDQAIKELPSGLQVYAGQADDPFFLDLRVFDLLYGEDLSEVGNGGAMRDDLHTLAGAYALNALPDEDRRFFESHLDRCADCAAEVGGLRTTAVRLGTAVAEPPPPELRAAVLSRIGEVRQLAPATADEPARSERAGPGWRAHRSRWRLRLAAGLAAGAVTASLLVAFLQATEANRTQQRLRQVEAANRAVAAVISAPDARKVQDPVTGGGTATVMVSQSRGQMVVTTEGLGRLPASKAYTLWMIGAHGVRSGGLLRPDAAGRTPPVVAGGWMSSTASGSPSNLPPDLLGPRPSRSSRSG